MRKLRQITPITIEAYELFHDGTLAFMDVERQGWPVDVEYLQEKTIWAAEEIEKRKETLYKSKELEVWKSLFGKEFKLDSPDQLRTVLFDKMGHTPGILTKTDMPSTSAEALEELDIPFVKDLLNYKQLEKAKTTYLDGILREQVDGIVHAFFGLGGVKTYRGSCGSPNLQNNPVRDPIIAELIRRAFRCDPGCLLLETDYSGAEVRIGCGYHHDPQMITYMNDSSSNMHTDMTAECFFIDEEDVTKDLRNAIKGDFVFAAFYGSYYKQMAPKIWKSTATLKLKDGTPLRKHLKLNKIKNETAFTKHIQRMEDSFWGDRFSVYNDWKEKWWTNYLNKGYFDMLTGFRYGGIAKKNAVNNAGIQGSAFHALLWSFNRIHEELPAIGKRNRILGQVHDSIILNVHPDDLQDVLGLIREISTERVRKHWGWINVPLEVDAEASPVDGTWFDKQEIAI